MCLETKFQPFWLRNDRDIGVQLDALPTVLYQFCYLPKSRPINILMLSEEAIVTTGRMLAQMLILYVLITRSSFGALVDSFTGAFLGVGVPLCYGLDLYTIFFKCYEFYGSYNVAFFQVTT